MTGVRGGSTGGGLANAGRVRQHLLGFTADDPSPEGSGLAAASGSLPAGAAQRDSLCNGVFRVAIESSVGSFGYITSCRGGDDAPGGSPGAVAIGAGDGDFFTSIGIPGDGGCEPTFSGADVAAVEVSSQGRNDIRGQLLIGKRALLGERLEETLGRAVERAFTRGSGRSARYGACTG